MFLSVLAFALTFALTFVLTFGVRWDRVHGNGEVRALKPTALGCVPTIKIEKSVSQQPLLLKAQFLSPLWSPLWSLFGAMSASSCSAAISKAQASHLLKELESGKTRRGVVLSSEELATRRAEYDRYKASVRSFTGARLRSFLADQEKRTTAHITSEATRVVSEVTAVLSPVVAMARGEVVLEGSKSAAAEGSLQRGPGNPCQ